MADAPSTAPQNQVLDVDSLGDKNDYRLEFSYYDNKLLISLKQAREDGYHVVPWDNQEVKTEAPVNAQNSYQKMQALANSLNEDVDKRNILFAALNDDWQTTLKDLATNGTLPRTPNENIADMAKMLGYEKSHDPNTSPDYIKEYYFKKQGLNPDDPTTVKTFHDTLASRAVEGLIPSDNKGRQAAISAALEAAKDPGSLKSSNEGVNQFLQLTAQAATGNPNAKSQDTLNLSPQNVTQLQALLAADPHATEQLKSLNDEFGAVLADKDKRYEAWSNNAAHMTGDAQGAEYRLIEAHKIATAINEAAIGNSNDPSFRQRSSQALTLLMQSAANGKNSDLAKVFATASALLQPNAKGIRPIDKSTAGDGRDPIQEEHDAQAKAEAGIGQSASAPPAPSSGNGSNAADPPKASKDPKAQDTKPAPGGVAPRPVASSKKVDIDAILADGKLHQITPEMAAEIESEAIPRDVEKSIEAAIAQNGGARPNSHFYGFKADGSQQQQAVGAPISLLPQAASPSGTTTASAALPPGTAVQPPPNTTYTPAPGTQHGMQVQPPQGTMTPGAYIGQAQTQLMCAPPDRSGAHSCFVLKNGQYTGQAVTIPAHAYPAYPYGVAPPSAAQLGQSIGALPVALGQSAVNVVGGAATTVVNIPVGFYNAFKPSQPS